MIWFIKVRKLSISDRVRFFFLLLLLFSFASIFFNVKIYPSIIFPHFPNKKMGKNAIVIIPKVFSFKTSSEVNLINLIKPYDKRFILFTKANLSSKSTTPNILRKLEQLNYKINNVKDSFYLVLTQKVVSNLK
jgi:hypothetical protein